MLPALLLLLIPLPAQSPDQWAKDFKVNGTPHLRVETGDANIHISASDSESNTIQARITTHNWKIGSDGIQIIDRQNGDEVQLEIRFPRRWARMDLGNRRVDVELRVPRRANLNIKTGDGNIDLDGINGEVNLQSGDGHLMISDVEGKVQANTGDGPVKMDGCKGEVWLHTGDGRIEVDAFEGALHAETGDGRVRVSGRFAVLDVKTGDGGVEATALQGSRMTEDWNLRTGDGGLTMRVPADLAADIDLHTGDGHLDLGVPVTISGRTGKNDIKGQMNGGGKLLTLRSGDGSIKIEKL
jgi:DUF4097 and DUF4098 domain-containing protein YvlB